jgi:predicted membrane channel-forming protein YqfA (hemolysin III family)
MKFFFGILAALQAAAWIPILVKFLKSWKTRSNPISLAICALVCLAIYLGVLPYWRCTADSDVLWFAASGVNLLVCGYFHLSFVWAKERFKNDDRDRSSVPPGKNDDRNQQP